MQCCNYQDQGDWKDLPRKLWAEHLARHKDKNRKTVQHCDCDAWITVVGLAGMLVDLLCSCDKEQDPIPDQVKQIRFTDR